MKFFKYLGIASIFVFCFYWTERLSNVVMERSALVKEINQKSVFYEISPISAVIDSEYIIPGLNGYAVNVLNSYDNMRYINAFNSSYLEYDIIKPSLSLENNKDKVIKAGIKNKNSVAIVVKNNIDVLNYSEEKNIKIDRLIVENNFQKETKCEQINNDFENYSQVETLLKTYGLNKELCFIDNGLRDKCLKDEKYLFTCGIELTTSNLAVVKSSIEKGSIICINDGVKLSDYKIMLRQIYYQDLNIVFLSDLIKEERD